MPVMMQRWLAGRPLIGSVLADGATLRQRPLIILSGAVVTGLLALTLDVPTLVAVPAPAVVALFIAVLFAVGVIDVLAGLAAIVATTAILALRLLPTSRGILTPLLGLIGQGIVLSLLVVITPLVARSLALTVGRAALARRTRRPRVARTLRFIVGPLGQGLLVAGFAALLAGLWFGGATAFLASVIPGASLLDVGPVEGAPVVILGGLAAGLVRMTLIDLDRVRDRHHERLLRGAAPTGHVIETDAPEEAALVRPTTPSRRITTVLMTAASTAVLLLLVSSLFSDATGELALAGVLLVLIRAIREGAIPEPVALLGRTAQHAFHRLPGIALFVTITGLTVVIAILSGTDMGRIRTGYLVLLAVVMLLTRAPGSRASMTSAPTLGSRQAVATGVLTVFILPALLAAVMLVPAPASARTPVPGLVGATSSLDYRVTTEYPARMFVPEGEEPEDDSPVPITTEYSITVEVIDAVLQDDDRLELVVDLRGRMAPWEGGDCTAAPFEIEVVIADSEATLNDYYEVFVTDPASLGSFTSSIVFVSQRVRVDCRDFSVSNVRIADRLMRPNSLTNGVIAAYHGRPLGGDVSRGEPSTLPATLEMSADVAAVDLTPVPVSAPAAAADSETPATTDEAPTTQGPAEAPGATAGGANAEGATADPSGASDADADADPDPDADPDADGAADDPILVSSSVLSAMPAPATPVPVPPLLGLIAPSLLTGAAGIALAGAGAGAGGIAVGAASSTSSATAATSAASGTGPAAEGDHRRRTSLQQASEGPTLSGRDLRPIVGLPDVDLQHFLEDETDNRAGEA